MFNIVKLWVDGLTQFAMSFVSPQVIRDRVLISDMNDIGVDVVEIRSKSEIDTLCSIATKYRPYHQVDYYFVGIDRNPENPDRPRYRFFDRETMKEFYLTEDLVKLLFYKVPGPARTDK